MPVLLGLAVQDEYGVDLQRPDEANTQGVVTSGVAHLRALLQDDDVCTAGLLVDDARAVRSRGVDLDSGRLAELRLLDLDAVVRHLPRDLGRPVDQCPGLSRDVGRSRALRVGGALDNDAVARSSGGLCRGRNRGQTASDHDARDEHHDQSRHLAPELCDHDNSPFPLSRGRVAVYADLT